jgi:hypothetical protein
MKGIVLQNYQDKVLYYPIRKMQPKQEIKEVFAILCWLHRENRIQLAGSEQN